MANLAPRQFTAIERVLSEIPDKSRTRQNLRYAKYKTREHEKVELIGSSLVALVFGLFLGGGTWGATIGYTALTFFSILAFIFFWHWIHAPGAFRDHWEAKANELPDADVQARRKAVLAERIRDLLREAGEVYCSGVSLSTMEGMSKVWRETDHHKRAKNFVKEHYGQETADRYDKEKSMLLEELLAESMQDENAPDRPKIKGAIEEVIAENALPEERLAGFDYYMTIRFWLRNEGVATNFRTFDLCLFVENAKQSEYKGDRLPLAGMCLDRKQYQKTGAQTAQAPALTRLQDYDAATPLEQWVSREGWLRFVVRNVEYADISSPDGKGLVFDRLELRVTDGSGKLWTLTTKPPWTKAGPGLEIGPCPGRPSDWIQLGGGSRAYFQPRYR